MSWLRSSPLRNSFSKAKRPTRTLDTATDCDPRACYDSFCKHWQQAYDIIQKAQPDRPPTHDDVLGVVSHLDHMVTLLLLEVHHGSRLSLPPQPLLLSSLPSSTAEPLSLQPTPPGAPCLEHVLSENLLDKLYEWGTFTGRYNNAVKLEQLKLYELLVSHSRQHLLVHEPFVRPLLKLLGSCQGEIFPRDVEARLVVLLNQLCVSLMQNVHLLDLFFFTPQDHGSTNFVIFSLLIPFVHREGPVGHQARDALLLCMALSKKNTNIGVYIAQHSNVCPVLATGLSGLYSLLPRFLDIRTADWHRLTPDDVNDIPELSIFMNSLEFCNAVAQVAHPMIKQQLLDFLYQGFLVPVMGPALLQTGIDEQVAATVYFDLVLRSVTEPGLLMSLVRFLLEENYDGGRILDVLVQRIAVEDNRLCLVSLALFETLVDLNCEDIMLELVFRHLLPGDHLTSEMRNLSRMSTLDPYGVGVDKLLALSPAIIRDSGILVLPKGNQINRSMSIDTSMQKTMPTNWNHYGLHTGESLYSNYHAYLCDARQKISSCQAACENWTNNYDSTHKQTNHQSVTNKVNGSSKNANGNQLLSTSSPIYNNSAYSQQNNSVLNEILNDFFMEATQLSLINSEEQIIFENLMTTHSDDLESNDSKKQFDSLQSLGESSGYESFKYKPEDSSSNYESLNKYLNNELTEEEKQINADRMFSSGDGEDSSANSLGALLTILFSKLQTMPTNNIFVNLHLTGLLSRISMFPHDLIRSLMLSSQLQTKPPVRSLYQILQSLKNHIDTSLSLQVTDAQQLTDQARTILIEREGRLVNARKNAIEAAVQNRNSQIMPSSTNQFDNRYRAGQSNTRSVLAAQYSTSNYDPFRRNEPKRKSLSSSISSMFRRTNLITATGRLSSLYEFITGSGTNQQGCIDEQNQAQSSNDSTIANESYWTSDQYNTGEITMGVNMPAPGVIIGKQSETLQNLVMCAVILDEWLKELAAILQEHTIASLSKNARGI